MWRAECANFATALEQGDEELDEDENGQEPGRED
jgi:hypothetical protein